MTWHILQGNNVDVLKTFPDNHFDSIVTDPPYGIDFLGKAWDVNTGALETYQECLRVLKPGGHILAFSAARTYHHLAITLEQAGFEIRDQIMWIYSSGFPKSQDIGRSIQRSLGVKEKKTIKSTSAQNKSKEYTFTEGEKEYDKEYNVVIPTDSEAKQWSGWGTSLKPAHEPIALARKPIKLSIAKNCQEWGVGALNIDATRVPYADDQIIKGGAKIVKMDEAWSEHLEKTSIADNDWIGNEQGRFPSNVIGVIPDYQKYFYCPKVSRKERHVGYDLNKVPTIEHNSPDTIHLHPLWTPAIGKNVYRLKQAIEEHNAKVPEPLFGNAKDAYNPETNERYAVAFDAASKGNNHPTVKPVELMKYLIKLITPPNGHILDPFNGSGSTGMAAVELGYEYTGIELDPAYVEIANKRIQAWYEKHNQIQDL